MKFIILTRATQLSLVRNVMEDMEESDMYSN